MDNLEVLQNVGAGNYGQVVLVRNKKSGATYVCKKVDLSNKTPAQQKEAENEVRTMSKLNHPNIVGFIEAFVERRVLHIVMEYADGSDLEKLLIDCHKNKAPLSEQRILDIFIPMALGLRQLHKQHLLHRDLKSANVFLTKSGGVKLGDFGFSKQLTYTMALASTVCGTPYYFSPELCQKLPYNNKSDVWSLGVILYEMINLRKPFEARNLPELRKRVVTEEPAPFNAPHISEELKQFCLTLLRKSSSTRPSVDTALQAPIIRRHLESMSRALEQQGLSARQKGENLKTSHPKRDGEVVQAKPEPAQPKAQPQQQDMGCMKTGKFDRNAFKKAKEMTAQTGDDAALHDIKSVNPPAQQQQANPAESDATVQHLHAKNVPNARDHISVNAPIDIVSEMTEVLVEEENCKLLKDDVDDVLHSFDVEDEDVVEAIGEAQTDDEKALRDALGETLFMKALQAMLQINAEQDPARKQKFYNDLLKMLGEKNYLVGDLQRVSAQFEIDE